MPDASDVRVSGLRKPGSGMSSDTYLFTIRSRHTGGARQQNAVLRCAPRADGPFPEYDLAMQFGVMRQLRLHTGVPVPEVLWYEEDSSWIGVPFLTMKEVAGQPALDWPSYHQSGFYAELPDEGRRAIWAATIEALAELHRTDWRAAGLDFVPGGRPGDDPHRYTLQYWRRFLDEWVKEGARETIPVYDAALEWLEHNQPSCPRPALVWGDAKLGNVMFDVENRKVAAVLDWEIAMIGDPQVDLASLRISDLRAQQGAQTCLAGTPSESELIEAYEKATGDRIRDWKYAMLYAAFWRGSVALKFMRRRRAQGHPVSDETLANHFPVPIMRDLLAS